MEAEAASNLEARRQWTAVLIGAQDLLAHSIGDPARYFAADASIRRARRELRRLEKEAGVVR